MLVYLDVQPAARQHGESGSGLDKPCCDWKVGIYDDWRKYLRSNDFATQNIKVRARGRVGASKQSLDEWLEARLMVAISVPRTDDEVEYRGIDGSLVQLAFGNCT